MNFLGIDLTDLKKEIAKFQLAQAETNALLKEQNQLLIKILIQLGADLKKESLNDSLKSLKEN